MSNNIHDDTTGVNAFPSNLYDEESYAGNWYDCSGIVGYLRTSANQSGEQRGSHWQQLAIQAFADSRRLPVSFYADSAADGRSILSRPKLTEAVRVAREQHRPLISFEWRRISRNPRMLGVYFPDVDFVSLVPLRIPKEELNKWCRREANRYNPSGKGGRPRDIESDASALPIILNRLGLPWTTIARELTEEFGQEWSGNKVSRLLHEYFRYIPIESKGDITG